MCTPSVYTSFYHKTDARRQSATPAIYGAWSKLNLNLPGSLGTLPWTSAGSAHRSADGGTVQPKARRRSWPSERAGCVVPRHAAEPPGSASSAAAALRIQEALCSFTAAIFSVNLWTDQIFTSFLNTARWRCFGTYLFRFDVSHINLIHTHNHLLCYR